MAYFYLGSNTCNHLVWIYQIMNILMSAMRPSHASLCGDRGASLVRVYEVRIVHNMVFIASRDLFFSCYTQV